MGSGISVHTARIPLVEVTVNALSAMEKETQTAACLLKDVAVDAVAFACTSGSLVKGLGHDEELAQKIQSITNCPVVVTAGAVGDALRGMDARQICLVTPYVDEVNKKEVEFLLGAV
jgi:maleate isomerase